MVSIEIPDSALAAVKYRADTSPTEEVCGIILRGEHRAVTNVAKDRAKRFRMEPSEQMAAWNDWRRNGDMIVYHSHPRGSVRPSDDDKWVMTRNEGITFLIYSVSSDDFAAYRWNGTDIVSVEIKATQVSTQGE